MSDEERDLRKYSRRSAIGLMGVGGGLAATETLGFTNLTADRGVNIGVADDLNSDLIIEASDDDDFDNETGELGDTVYAENVFIRFEHNAGTDVSIDSEDGSISGRNETESGDFTVSSSDTSSEADLSISDPKFSFNLPEEGDFVTIEVTNDSDETIDLSLGITDAEINGTTISLTRDFDVSDTT